MEVGDYRYGFNGYEKEDEIYGSGNAINFGARIYDPRLGRWFSTDPQMHKFPDWSPYHFSFDNPILFKDKDGEVPIIVIDEQSKSIMIYQPVFVVTKGPGAVNPADIQKLQKEFNDNIRTNHVQAISNRTGKEYDITVQFQFFDGGTFSDAQKKNKDAQKMLGMQVHGTLSSFSTDPDFEKKYKQLGGTKNPRNVGGVTANSMDIYMRGSKATWRERVHEGFHLLYLDDDPNAVGIMKYTSNYGQGPGVNMNNIQEALNKSMQNFSSIIRFDISGNMTQGDFSGESFSVQKKQAPVRTGPGSGMGGIHFGELESIDPGESK